MTLIEGSAPYSNITDSNTGILALHGFTGTVSSLEPLYRTFAEAGFNVECPRLSGHGYNWMELEKVKYTDWLDDAENSLKVLQEKCNNTIVVALSMGGALALYLAAMHPEIRGIILVNNALILRDKRLLFLPVLHHIIRTTPGIGSDIKDASKKEICYDTVPTKAVYEMLKLYKHVKPMLHTVKQPSLIFKSKVDHVVPRISALYTYKNISSEQKELVWLENSYHVATLDYDSGLICDLSMKFINRLL